MRLLSVLSAIATLVIVSPFISSCINKDIGECWLPNSGGSSGVGGSISPIPTGGTGDAPSNQPQSADDPVYCVVEDPPGTCRCCPSCSTPKIGDSCESSCSKCADSCINASTRYECTGEAKCSKDGATLTCSFVKKVIFSRGASRAALEAVKLCETDHFPGYSCENSTSRPIVCETK